MKKKGIISLGEAFVDYIATDCTNTNYQQFLGGATVNLAVGTSRLGLPVYYLCKLGTDSISQFVKEEFIREGIDTEFTIRTVSKKICGVYVHLTETGERSFHSYINPTPDEVLTADELKIEAFQRAKIFYFGSGTLFQTNAKRTTETALIYAKECTNLIAFDANLRLKRWESEDHCRKTVLSFLKHADIVKLAEDELCFLMETTSLEDGLEKMAAWKIPYLVITQGKKGAVAVLEGTYTYAPAPKVEAIDTNGAGDAFMAGLLYGFHEKGRPTDPTALTKYLEFANHMGAATTTEIGSLTAKLGEVQKRFFPS
ncbi:carbohydrate kinase [Bacillus sp. BRMEA1]|uniref:carbohydrate kinase family protein n=1 Tax=Neobacillus endophyticus TaxID=2738405 RepID=UPI00156310E6|nr:carbohydrate kinase [Neobacillus endophyticus]NRD79759.1 carbohydrate kinase [Neobacillus endophyticus]